MCVQVLEAVRTATLRHTKQRQAHCPGFSALRDVSRGRGREPLVELARGLADALRVVCNDRGREAGEVVRQELLRRGAAEAVGGAVGDLALVDEGGVVAEEAEEVGADSAGDLGGEEEDAVAAAQGVGRVCVRESS